MPSFTDWSSWADSQPAIPPHGNPYATVAVIGEAPGEREVALRRPFVGEAGKLLMRLVTESGLLYPSLWIENVVPFRPPHNDISVVPPEFLELYAQELLERLASLPNLNLLVPVGNTALVAVAKKKGITKWRGSIVFITLGDRQIKVLPTYHPAALLRSPGWMSQASSDWAKIRVEAASPAWVQPPPKREFLIYPTQKDLAWFKHDCQESALISYDIETNPKETQIICVGIAPSPQLAMCIPWESGWRVEGIRELLACPQAKCGQNAALYDNFWLSAFGAPVNNLTLDTMFLHHTIAPSEEHSLAVLASLLTSEPYWKDEAVDPKEGTSARVFAPSEATFKYNCKDAAVTHEIAGILEEEVTRLGKLDFYNKHYRDLFPALLSMMMGGMRVDEDEAERKFLSLSSQLLDLEAILEEAAGASLKAKKGLSPKKKAIFLYETLALPKKWTKGKNLSGRKTLATDEKTIRKLIEKNPTKLAKAGAALLQHARIKQLSTFYSASRISGHPGRFFYTLKPSTTTGRLASSKSPFGTGANAQNLDRECRSIYLPEPGHILCELDGSQVESRICYMLTGDPELVRLANTKPWEFDAHRENAARIFNIPLAQVTKEQRYTAKIAVHSAQRAGTGQTLSETFLKEMGMFKSAKECQGLIDSYFAAFPGVRKFFRSIQAQIIQTRSLTNLWGRTLTFPWERFGEDIFRQAYSFPMQSDCADWMNQRGVIPLHRYLENKHSRLLLTVHDSLLISALPEELPGILDFIIPSLERPLQYPSGQLVISVEIALGKNWGEKAYEYKKAPSPAELATALGVLGGRLLESPQSHVGSEAGASASREREERPPDGTKTRETRELGAVG
jgi:uracil-DNA glycosylase family 4